MLGLESALLFVFILAVLVGVAMVAVKTLSRDAEADRISRKSDERVRAYMRSRRGR